MIRPTLKSFATPEHVDMGRKKSFKTKAIDRPHDKYLDELFNLIPRPTS